MYQEKHLREWDEFILLPATTLILGEDFFKKNCGLSCLFIKNSCYL